MNKIITFLTIALFAIPACLFAAQSQNLESILLEAASGGNIDMVRSFLDNGANIEIKNEVGATPLIFASAKGQKEVVFLLLDRGANVNAKTTTGITPLMAAASGGYPDIVKLLLAKGADVSTRDQQGHTALDIAEAAGEPQVYALLKSVDKPSGPAPVPVAAPTAPGPVPVARPTGPAYTVVITEDNSPGGLKVRAGPSPQAPPMVYLPVGSTVTHLGEVSNGYVRLSAPVAGGWVARSSWFEQSQAMPSGKEQSGEGS